MQTIQMDVDPLAVNPVKLNSKPDSGALKCSGGIKTSVF